MIAKLFVVDSSDLILNKEDAGCFRGKDSIQLSATLVYQVRRRSNVVVPTESIRRGGPDHMSLKERVALCCYRSTRKKLFLEVA
ncbi:hypothetical protein IC582_026711 [Cucumis melo]